MQLAEIRYEVEFLQSLIDELSLCLDGLSIYTEAASNSYEMCPILALLAGAQEVVAQTRDSKYATAEEVEFRTNEIAKLLGLNSKLKVVKSRDYGSLRTTDIVTNSNFVRPIDRDLIAHLSPTAVIPLMWETWEVRDEDFDIQACHDFKILALGTNEHRKPIDMLPYNGILALSLLFQMNILLGKIVVIGEPQIFAMPMVEYIRKIGLDVIWVSDHSSANYRFENFKKQFWNDSKHEVMAVLIADHASTRSIIGKNGLLRTVDLLNCSRHLRVGIISGAVETEILEESGVLWYPKNVLPGGHMTFPMYGLGFEPVLKLYSGGLKVGEAMARGRKSGLSVSKSAEFAFSNSPAMDFQAPYSWLKSKNN